MSIPKEEIERPKTEMENKINAIIVAEKVAIELVILGKALIELDELIKTEWGMALEKITIDISSEYGEELEESITQYFRTTINKPSKLLNGDTPLGVLYDYDLENICNIMERSLTYIKNYRKYEYHPEIIPALVEGHRINYYTLKKKNFLKETTND